MGIPKVLVLCPERGGVIQEILNPLAALLDSCQIRFSTLGERKIVFEPVGILMSFYEQFYSPVRRIFKNPLIQEILANPIPLNKESFDFDVLILPGGFGREYKAFVESTDVQAFVANALSMGKLVCLQCHTVVMMSLASKNPAANWPSAYVPNQVRYTCWPSVYEKPLGLIPFVGKYFLPFGDSVESILSKDQGKSQFRARAIFGLSKSQRNEDVIIDRNLVTSIGPWSTIALGHSIMTILDRSKR